MATNDFLPFANGVSANVESQSAWVADSALRSSGFQAGVAPSAKFNKALRQSSIMAAVLAQFISDKTGSNSVDDGTTATLLANLDTSLEAMISAHVRTGAFSGVKQLNTSGTLVASDVGKAVALGGGTGGTATLPILSTTREGDAITLFCQGSQWAIVSQGPDTIYRGTGTIASFQIRGTEYVTFVNKDTSWIAVAGSWLSGALGVGSEWKTLTGSRVFGSSYTNNTGSSIAVSIGLIMVVNQGLELIVDNGSGIKVIDRVSGNYSASLYQTLHGVIPDGCNYQVRYFTGSGSVLDWWSELRRV